MSIPFGFAAVASGAAARGAARFGACADRPALLARAAVPGRRRARAAPGSAARSGIVAFFAVRRPALPRRGLVAAAGRRRGAGGGAASRDAGARATRTTPSATSPARAWCSTRSIPASPVARTRLGLWRRTLAVYREHPLSGVGPGNFPVCFRCTPSRARPRTASCRRRWFRGGRTTSCSSASPRPARSAWRRSWRCSSAAFAVGAGGRARGARARRAPAARDRRPRRGVGRARAASPPASGCGLTGVSAGDARRPRCCSACRWACSTRSAPARRRRRASRPRRRRAAPRRRAPRAGRAAGAVVLVAGRGLAVGRRASRRRTGGARRGRRWRAAATRAAGRRRGAGVSGARRARAAARFGPLRHRAADRAGRRCGSGRGGPALQAANRALALEPYSPHAWAARAAAELALRDEAQAARDDAQRAHDAVPRSAVGAHDAGDDAQARVRPAASADRSTPARRTAACHDADHARAARRHRSRLAGLDAGRRARARVAVPPLPARATSTRCATTAATCRREITSHRGDGVVRRRAGARAAARARRLSHAAAAVPGGDRIVPPRRLRPGDLQQPRRRQGRAPAARRAVRVVRAFADALRLGGGGRRTRRTCRAARSGGRRSRCSRAACAAGTWRSPAAPSRWPPTAATRRRASSATTAATRS